MAAYCPFCGAELDPSSAVPGELPQTLRCPVCGQEQNHAQAPGKPAAPAAPACPACPPCVPAPPLPHSGEGPAWEGEGGLVSRLWRTTWQMLGYPFRTLESQPRQAGLSWPLSYGLVLGTFSTALTLLWGLLLQSTTLSTWGTLWLLFLSPLITLAEMFITSALVHVMLFILGGNQQGFGATFRANAYAEAAGLLAILPMVGTPVVLIWHLVILTGGLAAAQGIGKGRAFAAIILPPLIILLLALMAMMALGLTALLAFLGEVSKGGGGQLF